MIKSVLTLSKSIDDVYFTITQSIAGNLRDLIVIYLLRKKRIIIHLHGGGIKTTVFDKSRILRKLNKLILKHVDQIIVLGESLKYCYTDMNVDSKLITISNSADDIFFIDRSVIRNKYKQDKIKILFLSNLIDGKGHLELVEAIKLLPNNLKLRVKVQFAGGFESSDRKFSFLESIKNEDCIEYLGIVKGDKRALLFSQAQIFCLPTYYPYEGQPISILESYASGCCVITTAHNGIIDIFKNNKNGILVEKKSVNSLKMGIISILNTDIDELTNIGLYNNSLATKLYTNKIYIDNMSKLLIK